MACTNGCCSSSSELTTPLAVICPPGSEVTFSHWAIEPAGLTRTFMHTTWLSPTRLAPAKTSMLMICWSPTLSPGSPRSTSVKPTVLPVRLKSPPLPCLSAWAVLAPKASTGRASREMSFLFMGPMLRVGELGAIGDTPEGLPQSAGKLRARADVQLAVGAGQMHLDRLLGQEQRLGDLAVGHALGGHARDALLGRGQLAPALDRVAPRARAGGDQLVVGLRGDCGRVACRRELDGFGERRPRVGAAAGAAMRGAEREEAERELEARRRRAKDGHGFIEVFDLAAREAGCPQRHSERSCLAERPRPGHVL